MTHSIRRPRARGGLAALAAALVALGAPPAPASLVSESSAFGAGTITRDTASGLRWLDLTVTAGRSYATVVGDLASGDLAGYRLATDTEVLTFFEHAGIDSSESDFVPQNHDPIVALAGLVGQLADNGSCGSGCSFFFSSGWIDNTGAVPPFLTVATIAWFDNSAPLSGSYPQAPIGRASFGDTTDGPSTAIGAWLVQAPEPPASLGPRAAGLALVALALSRSARSARRPRRARRR